MVPVAEDDAGFSALDDSDDLSRMQAIVRQGDGIHLMVDILQLDDQGKVEPGLRVKIVLRKHKREDIGSWVYGYGLVLE